MAAMQSIHANYTGAIKPKLINIKSIHIQPQKNTERSTQTRDVSPGPRAPESEGTGRRRAGSANMYQA